MQPQYHFFHEKIVLCWYLQCETNFVSHAKFADSRSHWYFKSQTIFEKILVQKSALHTGNTSVKKIKKRKKGKKSKLAKGRAAIEKVIVYWHLEKAGISVKLSRTMFYRIIFLTVVSLLTAGLFAEELRLKQTDGGYEIRINDNVFAGYISNYEGTPIIYPIIGPVGKNMTRSYPMEKEYEGMKADHPHHRSLWFSHGEVNKLDFWTAKCKIVHKRFVKTECDGQTALIVTENDWVDNNSQTVCSDIRTIRFAAPENKRIIDFDITITAAQEKVVFGDTKEGTFGIRVPETIAVETNKGGQFVNAEGKSGERDAWGKRSAWINYHGVLDGEKVGIAILNHPSSFRYPTYWHVRDYGLFSANPFGVHDFERLQDDKAGEHSLPKGESFTVRYRVIFHKGDNIADAFKEYAEQK